MARAAHYPSRKDWRWRNVCFGFAEAGSGRGTERSGGSSTWLCPVATVAHATFVVDDRLCRGQGCRWRAASHRGEALGRRHGEFCIRWIRRAMALPHYCVHMQATIASRMFRGRRYPCGYIIIIMGTVYY